MPLSRAFKSLRMEFARFDWQLIPDLLTTSYQAAEEVQLASKDGILRCQLQRVLKDGCRFRDSAVSLQCIAQV